MRPATLARLAPLALAAALIGCSETSRLQNGADVGPDPTLVEPVRTMLPTVKVAKAVGWPEGERPVAAPGLEVQAFATGLDHPRWLQVLPNGDVLVAETNAPERPEKARGGLKNWFMKLTMKKAGAGVPSADRVTLLRDADGDGRAETRVPFLENLHSPFGMALVGDRFFVANTDAVMEYPYRGGETRITGAGRRLAELPAGPRNHHWTKSLIASLDGRTLYATVGSNSNVAENGLDEERGRAAIWAIDVADGAMRLYASGLRNPNGMAWEPATGLLWVVVNERDELGSDLVPDYLTSVREGGFYGWPFRWWGDRVETRVPAPPTLPETVRPDYALGAHVAALGLAAARGSTVTTPLGGATDGMFVGEHGSWNRRPPSGYKVVFVPFVGGRPSGKPVDVLTGFLDPEGQARGRPVGVAVDRRGALLVADDVGNTVWRVVPAARAQPPQR
ncbi:PQQ-dependent sugar dehydrogenase [Rubrivivax gelatinosus]|uniref:Dehydrogenase n=1 Tax=Rubrivivax gelatinosus (strain NBRC 100245 / IL144) TaxID=983917 RepID=I0HSK8_RUBGI|nr:sorbosone dehydrogenase family protein [Rubrivivax gelatinosus]BAL95995.1 dehydrogenase [Rubrivivax gelatinosus IL144]